MTKEIIRSVNLDQHETVFFQNELRFIKAATYDIIYPELKATNAGLLPISSEAGIGAENITYRQFDQLGRAKIIANYADDLPRSCVEGREFTSNIRGIGASYGYSIQEIRAAEQAGRNLVDSKARAARYLIEYEINQIAWFGNPEYKLFGLLKHPHIPRDTVKNDGANSSTEWVDKDAEKILRDLNQVVDDIMDGSKGVETPNTLLLPRKQWALISKTPRSATSDTTILNFFLSSNPVITRVEWLNELEGAGTGGTDAMIAYNNSSDKLTLELPLPFEQFPAQERNFEFVVNCHARCGGVLLYYPLSAAIREGI